MKSLLFLAFMLSAFVATSQNYVPSAMLASGVNNNGYVMYIEGGVWKNGPGVGLYGGVMMHNVYEHREYKEGEITTVKTGQIDPYIRLTAKVNQPDDCRRQFIHSVSALYSLKSNYGGSYRLSWRDYDSMISLEPNYTLRGKMGINFVVSVAF